MKFQQLLKKINKKIKKLKSFLSLELTDHDFSPCEDENKQII